MTTVNSLVFEKRIFENVWNMKHRLALGAAKEEGMSGTNFLAYAEKYLTFLYTHKLTDLSRVEADVVQPRVMDWFLKNGYTFSDEESAAIFTEIKEQPGRFIEVILDWGGMDAKDRDVSLVREEILQDENFADFSSEKGGVLTVDMKEEGRRMFATYLPTVSFYKDLAV